MEADFSEVSRRLQFRNLGKNVRRGYPTSQGFLKVGRNGIPTYGGIALRGWKPYLHHQM